MLAAPLARSLARPLASALTGFAARKIRKIAFLGDSITNQNSDYSSPNTILLNDAGFAVWSACILHQRFTIARRGSTDYDFGYSGKRADEIAAYIPDVINSAPDTCFELTGTNDVAQSGTPATIAARRAANWAALQAAGIRVIAGAIPPAVNSTAQAATVLANAAIKSAAQTIGIPFIEWPESLLSAGVANSNYFPDGIHPNAIGAEIMGRHLASAIDHLVTADAYSFLPAASALWITPNPYVTGGTTTATNWVVATPAAGNTITPSKVGDWQQIACAGNGTNVNIVYAQNLTYPNGGWEIGDLVRGVAQIESDASGWAIKNLNIIARFHSSANGGYDGYNSGTAVLNLPSVVNPITGIRLTPPVVIPAATTRIQLYIQFYGQGTFRFKKAGVFKIP